MALLFVDGFDHYVTADFAKKGWNTAGSPAISTAAGRRGTAGLRLAWVSGAAFSASKTVGSSAGLVVGFALSVSAMPDASVSIANFTDGATVQCSLRLNPSGTLAMTQGSSTAVTGGTSTFAITSGVKYYIELKATIADSIAAGSCKVRVNGADVITVETGRDLKVSANASADVVVIGPINKSGNYDYDDLYICNTSGAARNDFLGDVRVDALYPVADGAYSAFTPSTAGAHYVLVDETAPNTTDYNDGLNVGDRDSYALGDLPALDSQAVYGVQVNAAMLKDDAGAKSAATFVRSGTTNGDGASVALGTSLAYASQVFELNPNGSVAWTETSVNAMEAGVLVTA